MKTMLKIGLLCLFALNSGAQEVFWQLQKGQPFPLDSGVAVSNAQYDAWQINDALNGVELMVLRQQKGLLKTQLNGCELAKQRGVLAQEVLLRQNEQLKIPPKRGFWKKVEAAIRDGTLFLAGAATGAVAIVVFR